MRKATKVRSRATEHVIKGQQALLENKSPLNQGYAHIKQMCLFCFSTSCNKEKTALGEKTNIN